MDIATNIEMNNNDNGGNDDDDVDVDNKNKDPLEALPNINAQTIINFRNNNL